MTHPPTTSTGLIGADANIDRGETTRPGRSCGPKMVARGKDAGYSVIEFVIIVPLMFSLFLFSLQVVFLWHGRHVAQAAALEGATAARDYGGDNTAGARSAGTYLTAVAPVLLSNSQVNVTRTPTQVTVRVRAQVQSLIPGIRFAVDERTTAPIERFVAASR